MKYFFYITVLVLLFSCKKTIESPPSDGPGSGTGNGPGNGTGGTIYKRPVAVAGPDQVINILSQNVTALLNGSGSYDSTGQPLLFYWRQISGPSNSFLQTPAQGECMVYNLNSPGDYSYELKVWNNREMDFDTTVLSVGIPSYCQSSRSEVPVSLTFLSNYPGQGQIPEIIVAGSKLVMPEWWDQSNGVPGNKIYMYDLLSQTWNTIQASTARIGVATVAAGNKVFFAGGMDGWDGNYNVTPVVDIYDLTTNTWSVSNLSEARGYCKAVVSGSKIFFAGGLNSSNVLSNKVDIYDLVTNNWSSAVLPSGAKQVGAALSAFGKVLFCGGYTKYEDPTGWGNTFTTPTNSIDIYDLTTGQWSTGSLQVNKSDFAAISVNEKAYFAGGLVNNAASFHVEELNVNTMTSSHSCLHQPMVSYNEKSAAIKNDLILFFTPSYFTGIERNKFDIYNTQNGMWSVAVFPLHLIPDGVASTIVSVNNEVFASIGDKLYKMNL